MNRILTAALSLVIALAAFAQASIPFDVQTPSCTKLIRSKTDNGPLVFHKPNASSDNLVMNEGAESNSYRWLAPSMYCEPDESRFTVSTTNCFPLKRTQDGWTEIEFIADDEHFDDWCVSYDLASIPTYMLTPQEVIDDFETLAWWKDNEL